MKTRLITITAMGLLLAARAGAQVVHVAVGPLARASLLRPSTHRYVRYVIEPDGSRHLVDIWARRLTFEASPDGGRREMRIQQRWDRPDGSRVLIQDSWFEPTTFRPLDLCPPHGRGGQDDNLGFPVRNCWHHRHAGGCK